MRLLRLASAVMIVVSTLMLAHSTSLANSPLVSRNAASTRPDSATQAKIVGGRS